LNLKKLSAILAVLLVSLLLVAIAVGRNEGDVSLDTEPQTQTTGTPETVTEQTDMTTEQTELETLPSTENPTVPETTAPEKKTYTVCIDAGHQRKGISEKEPNGPGSTVMKAKLSSGTQGVVTRIPEYQLNLDIALMLEQTLLAEGYKVVMIRRTNDCPLSNAERATVANESGADIFVRIHANGSDNREVHGMLCCAPTEKNPYLTAQNISESIRLSEIMVEKFCRITGANNRGIYSVDTMTGINWCQIPVTIVEMGYMSNPEEDQKMATQAYREQMVQGIVAGINAYFYEE